MTDSPYVFEATLENFQQDVIEASMTVPVVVDFWADWCQPCHQLMPVLQKLAAEYQGAFLLAKVNADEQQQLAAHLGVRSLPTVKIVKGGRLVDEFTGAVPEGQVRGILDKHVEKPPESVYDQGKRLWSEGKLDEALALLMQANQEDPKNLAVLIDIAQLKAESGDIVAAREILDSLPPEEKLQPHAKQLAARLKFLEQAGELPPEAELEARLEQDGKDLEALYLLALHRVLKDDNEGAMELLIRLMQADRHYRDGLARTTLIELFDLLGNEDPAVKQYRRKLYALMY
ncbi:thioredoxin family protein [Mangrovitalea sediminis]|uniref:thioredoxin family protein n=1 Tax=Mangrovitalea sediminis TaxID=1982043 RepID=UPI000BE5CA07|nr:co-chaperone YbbN [Mangrovitalea sediminis]